MIIIAIMSSYIDCLKGFAVYQKNNLDYSFSSGSHMKTILVCYFIFLLMFSLVTPLSAVVWIRISQ